VPASGLINVLLAIVQCNKSFAVSVEVFVFLLY
jgi:hypothetical protein